ncbi:putative cysteine-rich receptor-like protein kinase 12 [Vigna radiata var. radiata]|uniref:Cysteine-rich receptor-like protein kinase 12 n=1 Tax=Vigna radiata var. radiata TaxID=3916 RepID=A0A1S3T9E3_VIGRR|nr:putative cysteine-rich receptor-like protein kinase 12 [Vigna radiata var. radiata]
MAPEYTISRLFSIKYDVYSYKVLLLEIAWRMWKEDSPMILVDASLGDSFNISEALRCIHVGLLCVQLHPDNRPNMASVIFMLSGENILREPKEPGFLVARMKNVGECSTSNAISTCTNELTITLPHAR